MITMEELFKLLVNSSGALAVSAFAFFYMERNSRMFNQTIQEYLRDSINVKMELSARLQQFSDTSQQQKEMTRELKDVIQRMYLELVKKKEIQENIYKKSNKN